MELLARKRELEMALLEALVRLAFGMPASAVPDHDGAATVFTLREAPQLARLSFPRLAGARFWALPRLDLDGEPRRPADKLDSGPGP